MRVILALLLPGALLFAADESGFRKHIQPFLTRHCVMCHNPKAKLGNLDLQRFTSAEKVLAEQDVWDKVAAKITHGEMPPKGRPVPPTTEVTALRNWLTAEYARYDKRSDHDPGRVTARRLNRVEYNNTIRDLTGLDLKPASAFPPDDSGYGFDNIGDVLSLSPALMEKYMNAASQVLREAIATPRTYKEMNDRYRVDRVPQTGPPGSIEVKHRFPVEADYTIRIAMAGRRLAAGETLSVITELDGKTETFDANTPPNRPRILEWKIRTQAGAKAIKAQYSAPVEGMLIEYLEVRGPYNPAPFTPPPSHARILVCGEWPGKYDDACIRQIVETFARRAFRRPVTPAETDKYTKIALAAKQDGESPEQSIRYALQGILVSPHFLFRIERDAKPGLTHPVNNYELASRLSYFLWASMPDDTLLAAAQQGNVQRETARMIADPKFSAFIENFTGQWLELRNLDEVKPTPEKFPQFDNALREAMKKETQLFFASLITNNGSLLDLIDAPYTFLNERLARHYGISGVEGSDFRRVDLNTPQRGGVLSHASILTVSSYPNRTSPVIRGKFLLENFLNAPPPPPPPNVPSLEESAGAMGGTLRQQMQKHRTNAVCASCHQRMDTLGFGLENYDAIGAWRDSEGGVRIDPSGELPGNRTFNSPAELKKILKSEKDAFAQCVTEKLLIYALGRGLERNDRTFVRQIVHNVAADGYRLRRLIEEIVNSAPFRMRRAESTRDKVASIGN
ncbi:MAG: DUF1592 domain-containing protein [Acidobacteria bacterium]|nr:DUF1592 domain-containing protein [Acidobacteriota bacterium]